MPNPGVEFVQVQYKSFTTTTAVMITFVLIFLIGQFFPILISTIDYYVFLVFAGTSACSVLFLWKYVPESKNKDPETIQKELDKLFS